MDTITLTAKNTPVQLIPTGRILIHNKITPVQAIYLSKHGNVNLPWIPLPYDEQLILDSTMYLMYREGQGDKIIPVMELF